VILAYSKLRIGSDVEVLFIFRQQRLNRDLLFCLRKIFVFSKTQAKVFRTLNHSSVVMPKLFLHLPSEP